MQTAENKLFPVFLKLEKFRVLVIGGGKVALEKVRAILQNSPATRITLVSINVIDEIVDLGKQHPNLTIEKRPYQVGDLDEKDFIIAAVNSRPLSLEIKQEAERRRIITNVADTPEQCDFYLGSIVQKGNIKIAVSTNGKSPTIAKRIREVFEEKFPEEINESLDNLSAFRKYLAEDFSQKVKTLNSITSALTSTEEHKAKKKISRQRIFFSALFGLILLITGYVFAFYFSPKAIGDIVDKIDISQWRFALIGFTAEVINGALGMAYGVTTTTMLLASGIAPAFVLIIVHILEVFTAGATGVIHYRVGNVNKKLLSRLLLPGILGAIAGAYLLSAFRQHTSIIKPAVSVYTLILGLHIIYKTVRKIKPGKKIKNIYPLAAIAGFLDAIGGGGWGTIVSSTLIAGGRSPRYTIGSVILSRFFVALASSISLLFLVGFSKWTIIGWLVAGGLVGSPVGPFITKHIPTKVAMWLVAITIIILSLKQIIF
jgi:siroheme synthase-like protein